LKEETKIRVSEEELHKHVKKNKVFDHPQRSLRGRLITHAFLIDLGIGDLPYVKGSDDAEEALWLPLGELSAKESEFFDDHYYIIQHLISNLDNWLSNK
jgi:bifunctional NMN adenylyltransferase/nudix hydrolase